jgi:hypothetical protein
MIPKKVREALEIDKDTNTTYWTDAIKKKNKGLMPDREILDNGKTAPFGYQEIPCHIIFDIKMDFTQKARFVAGGHVTRPPMT